MLLLSKFPIKTLKSAPKISDNKSTSLLLQAWFIRQEMAWVYNYLPFWLRVLENIKKIVRDEMNAIWWQEILLSSLSNKESWLKTKRWDTVDVLFKLEWAWNKEYWLNPTHEEVVTPLMQEFIQSYKDLDNMSVYQIQTKFRNEKRAKSWILRWREFIMKDLYSFHTSQENLINYYNQVKNSYMNIYNKLGIWEKTYPTLASGWDFTTLHGHEFQTILDIWEDEIYICKNCKTSHNKEIVDEKTWFICTNCKSVEHTIEKASEVWNIFPLMTRFSDAFWVKYDDENWKSNQVFMWCYGIGISRLMWVIAEYFMDDLWLVWPENIAPYSHYIIVMWNNLEKAKNLALEIEKKWWEVIIDDREKVGFWQKASDSDLFWIPNRIVISDKTLELGWYELKTRKSKESVFIKF